MRATAKVAAITMTNVAGSRPMELPSTATVSGWTKASRMMNGIGRMKFTRMLMTKWMGLFCRMPPGRVV